ncbi:hypothetical protein [Marinomonas sp. S3726]|uniref:hypothetical protein n=1 Tax=Marinomonas sp. S3726 TaxID=579484 RepID=UPI000A7192C0|nr:hypothetical protein [Marinomonas sp. S3726]
MIPWDKLGRFILILARWMALSSMRLFTRLPFDNAIPDHTTIMNFRHPMEKSQLFGMFFMEEKKWISEVGIYLKESEFVIPLL